MMVCQENVANGRQGDVGKYQLPGDPVAAIDNIRRIVDDEHLCSGGARLPGAGSTTSAEKNQFIPAACAKRGDGHAAAAAVVMALSEE